MSRIEETAAIGNVPAEGESTPDHSGGRYQAKTKYRVSLDGAQREQQVVLSVTDGYAKSRPGLLNFFQVLASLACLIALVSSGVLQFGHERDDKDSWWWRYRLLIFVSVFSALVSFSALFLHVCGVVEILPLDWTLFDLVMYVSMGILHLVSCSLVIDSDVRLNDPRHGEPPAKWSRKHMIAAMVFSYLCVLAYVASSVQACVDIRRQLRRNAKEDQVAPREEAGGPQRFQLFQQPSNSTVVESA